MTIMEPTSAPRAACPFSRTFEKTWIALLPTPRLSAAIERAGKYVEAGADMIFAEAMTSLDEYRQFTQRVKAPVLANLTEFGRTPLFSLEELRTAGVAIALYPLSAFRAMSEAFDGPLTP